MPAHGWYENVLKWGGGRRRGWPRVHTTEEELAWHWKSVERGRAARLLCVSMIWHPWSLGRLDPGAVMPAALFSRVRDAGMTFSTFEDQYGRTSRASVAR